MRAEAAGFGLKVKEPLTNEEQRVLHQERTGGRFLGYVISKMKGEHPREGLLEPPSGATSSIDIDQTACDNLLNPIEDIQITGGDKSEVTRQLEVIDRVTLKILLKLRSRDSNMNWTAYRTLEEVHTCNDKISRFLGGPYGSSNNEFSTALALFVILGGDTQEIVETLDRLDDSYVETFANALGKVTSTLHGWDVQIPKHLATSIEKINKRLQLIEIQRAERERQRQAELRRRAAETKLKPLATKKPPE
jgi:hypothetical protein